jgi:hypothetical protein
MGEHVLKGGYEVPTYQASAGAAWYHFLHGNVPGHQIDFIYRPEVPQGALTRQHFSHLARLVKYIEPRHGSAYAFAIGNLSRDDTQHEPGHGGLALIFGLRIKGAKDHAGRQDPPFCHSVATIDRHVDGAAIYEAAVQLYHKLLPDEESQAEGSGWYHTYVQYARNPHALVPLLRGYVGDFEDLPAPGPSGLGYRWTVEGATPPRRVVVVYPDEAQFEVLAYCMARIATVLVESDIRWTAISNGREQDVQGGLTVRFVPRREATAEPADVVMMYLEQVPEDPHEIAAQLFNAQEVRVSQMPDLRMSWRQMYAQQAKASANAPSRPPGPTVEVPVEVPEPATQTAGLGLVAVVEKTEVAPVALPPQPTLAQELKKQQRRQQLTTLVGFGLLIALLGLIAAIWFGTAPTPVGVEEAASAVASAKPAPKPSGTVAQPAVSVVPGPSGDHAQPIVIDELHVPTGKGSAKSPKKDGRP